MTVATQEWPPGVKQEVPARVPPIVELEFDPEARPDWAGAAAPLHMPVPPWEPRAVREGHVLVGAKLGQDERLPLVAVGKTGLELAYPWRRWEAYIRSERYATWRRRPLHTRSPISYRIVPPRLRNVLAGRMCRDREKQETAFPRPPMDGGFEALRSVVQSYSKPAASAPPPRVCLTHDIDTAGGFAFVKEIASLECSLGLRSSWNVVPYGYRVDHGVCDWLIEQGFEIGLHGYCHDNRLIYLPESGLRRRLEACREFIERYSVRGFRSPSWLRNPQLMRVLADYVDYDCSCLDFDWLSPAGRAGVLTATPFRFGRLVEIPTTLPFEAPLLVGAGPVETIAYWREKVDWLVQVRGQAVLNTHPDPHYSGNGLMIRAYGQFLEELLTALSNQWSLPRELADEVPPIV